MSRDALRPQHESLAIERGRPGVITTLEGGGRERLRVRRYRRSGRGRPLTPAHQDDQGDDDKGRGAPTQLGSSLYVPAFTE